jgi:hypothetical protein
VARACLDALAATLLEDGEAFGLREAVRGAGARLIDALEALGDEGVTSFGPLVGDTVEERRDVFAARLVDAVAGEGATIADAAVRRAAAGPAIERLLRHGDVYRAIETPRPGSELSIPDELFCAVYELFFADAVGEFLKTVIAEKIKLAVPVLYAFDPAGRISEWVAERIYAELPKPCEAKNAAGSEAPSLAELARGLLEETVDRALGIAPATEAAR